MARIPCPECGSSIDTSTPGVDGGYACSRCGFSLTPVGDTTTEPTNPRPPVAPTGPTPLPEEWEMLAELGRGGMGVVYRARHRLTEELVALKSITGAHATDPEYARRFAREVKVLHRLHHPGVVRLLHSGLHQGSPWLALELVEGRTLREAMRGGPMALREVLRIGSRIAEALEYTHSMEVVHRDLKPENVLTTPGGQVKVTDFGLAGLRSGHGQVSRLTRDGATLGTYDYMAPEQRGGAAEAGPAADLYSLGVMSFEMLTGRLPHGAEAPGASLPGVPPELDRLVARMLEREPERRPAGAAEVRQRLEELNTCSRKSSSHAMIPAGPPTAYSLQPTASERAQPAQGEADGRALQPAQGEAPWGPAVTETHAVPDAPELPEVPSSGPAPRGPVPAKAPTSLARGLLFGWWSRSPALTVLALGFVLLGVSTQVQRHRKPPEVPVEPSPAEAVRATLPAFTPATHGASTPQGSANPGDARPSKRESRPGPPRWPGPPPGVKQLPSPSQSLPDPSQTPTLGLDTPPPRGVRAVAASFSSTVEYATSSRESATGGTAVRRKPPEGSDKDGEISLGDPSIQMTVQTYLAESALEKGNLKEAIGHYVYLRNRQPGVPRVHKRLAELYVKAGLPDNAASEYRAVLRMAPGDREARAFLALRKRAGER